MPSTKLIWNMALGDSEGMHRCRDGCQSLPRFRMKWIEKRFRRFTYRFQCGESRCGEKTSWSCQVLGSNRIASRGDLYQTTEDALLWLSYCCRIGELSWAAMTTETHGWSFVAGVRVTECKDFCSTDPSCIRFSCMNDRMVSECSSRSRCSR